MVASLSRYQKVKRLGRGSFGQVELAVDHASGMVVALKQMARAHVARSHLGEDEVLLHMQLSGHPHITQLHEVLLGPDELVLALEYAPGGDLASFLPPGAGLPEGEARWLFQQIIFGVHFMHSMGTAWRDLKLENVLVFSTSSLPLIKLADFGLATRCDAAGCARYNWPVGTPAYFAPELLAAAKGQLYNAQAADCWAAGVLLYMLLTGSSPFQRSTDRELGQRGAAKALFQRIHQGKYRMPPWISPECRDLLSSLLEADPARRLSAAEVLQHPWCAGHGIVAADILRSNAMLVAESLAHPPAPELVSEVRSLFQEVYQFPGGAPQEMEASSSSEGSALLSSTGRSPPEWHCPLASSCSNATGTHGLLLR